jgi:ABC-type iron transport system FetAB ATPase subunit
VVANILTVKHRENVHLDPKKLSELYSQLGETSAEDVVCRAIEELAVRLTHCERLWRQDDIDNLRKSARSLIAISEQIGMMAMANIARDVTDAIDADDSPAVAATLFRLIRVGESSLTAVWEQHDLTV